ncbi:unnamed protein product, partial [Oppiella nova]
MGPSRLSILQLIPTLEYTLSMSTPDVWVFWVRHSSGTVKKDSISSTVSSGSISTAPDVWVFCVWDSSHHLNKASISSVSL